MVERKHQHLLNIACALLFQANMPKYFWSYAVIQAAFLINRIPSKSLHTQLLTNCFTTKPVIFQCFVFLVYFALHQLYCIIALSWTPTGESALILDITQAGVTPYPMVVGWDIGEYENIYIKITFL